MILQLQMGPNFDRTVAELGRMGADLVRAVSTGLGKGVNLAAAKVITDYLTGQSLKKRTGWLASDLDGVVGIRPNSAVSKYAWILGDETKTITPKRGKFLTIPIGENLTSSGTTRYTSPRQVEGGFFVKTKGRLLFGYKKGKRGKFRALFTLVKSVTIQGSGALYDGVFDSLDDIADQMGDEIERAIG